ncbi:MAG: hypothetical protein HOU81_15655 [Hamadaea sp.]|uniref:hypothetical protein n=1 Tax=Hamadaea sp. TaxID=2024425 RepID=UPI0017EEB600|nr:hypothetical protein [Hamadaea sp.]NUR72248.1 hypothetical protein [Hamadaea sp.]NUT17679.1 hypothetical protein [Hamadaea sp.]
MYDVVILTLEEPPSGCGGDCGACGHDAEAPRQRTPVLHCADALKQAGARVEAVTAYHDEQIDEVLARFDAPEQADGVRRPDPDTKVRLIVAVTSDSQLRHVVRRMVRRYAPPPSKRPENLPADRTVPDLPALGVLPLAADAGEDLAARLGLARQPAEVARAVLADRVRRLDLLRQDGGSVVIDGVLLGAADQTGRSVPFRGRIEVDDLVLTDGADDVLACAVTVADGYARLDGIDLVATPDPTDGVVEVGIAVPALVKRRFGRDTHRVEVRRARGRAVSIAPRLAAEETLPFVEDGVTGELTRKRSWWIERQAWAVYS